MADKEPRNPKLDESEAGAAHKLVDAEALITGAEFQIAAETISRVLSSAHPLIEKVSRSTNPDLKRYGWWGAWEPSDSNNEHWKGLTRVGLNAAESPPNEFSGDYFDQGPNGESIYINAYIDTTTGEPVNVFQLQGTSAEGRFKLHYMKGGRPGAQEYQAGVTATLEGAEYDLFFRGGNKPEIGLRIIPLPLGQVKFIWQDNNQPQIGENGIFSFDKTLFGAGTADFAHSRGEKLESIEPFLESYSQWKIKDRDVDFLRKWLAQLPTEVSLSDLLAKAETQAIQAIEALTKLADDFSHGIQLTPDKWKKERYAKYRPEYEDESLN